ncbi:MAG: hypothetical protein LBD41_01965 [Clostridiales Family XIII bacterium]|jgi:sensor domain CHASE-containing protein|nr:hypothetical protein [Clostridiales Family XIII bacterium]
MILEISVNEVLLAGLLIVLIILGIFLIVLTAKTIGAMKNIEEITAIIEKDVEELDKGVFKVIKGISTFAKNMDKVFSFCKKFKKNKK